ncbi:MAG: family 43 glycosylhydrolase [Lachnospiraceae bacterium]|nr:family 43 glycosylhydrolase [Lachnospiraceae bacterium]
MTYKNPILYLDYSDPDVIRVGEDYYMVASSFCNAPGLPLLHSKDLVNWNVVNYVIDKIPTERYNAPIHGCGVWAPAIRYHEGTYYVCFPMPDEGIYMTTATDPFGKWSEPVNIRPGAGWIDPCPFWDDDGNAYLVAGVAKSRIGYKSVLHLVRMQPDGMGLYGEEVRIYDGNLLGQETIEGPKMYKRNGYYYIFAPAGGVKPGWQTVLRSKNIWGPYETRVVMRQGKSEVNGPHQGAWIDTVTGEDWFIHFQDVFAAGRIVHLQPMYWENDWPVIGVKSDEANEYGEPVNEYRMPDTGYQGKIEPVPVAEEYSDYFKNNVSANGYAENDDKCDSSKVTYNMHWQWNANYDKNWYDAGETGLKLYAVPKEKEKALSDVSNLLLKKWFAPEFVSEIAMDFSNLNEGDSAGVISLGVEYGAIVVEKLNGELIIKGVRGTQIFNGVNVSTSEDELVLGKAMGNRLIFRYEVITKPGDEIEIEGVVRPHETIRMSYREADDTSGSFAVACEYKAVAGRWVGVKYGVFCCGAEDVAADARGYAVVEYVKVK